MINFVVILEEFRIHMDSKLLILGDNMPSKNNCDDIYNLESELIELYYDFDLSEERKEKLISDLNSKIKIAKFSLLKENHGRE